MPITFKSLFASGTARVVQKKARVSVAFYRWKTKVQKDVTY